MKRLYLPVGHRTILLCVPVKVVQLWLLCLGYAVILEPKKIKFVTVSTFSPSTCHEVMGLDAMILVF